MIEEKSAKLWEQSKTRIPGGVNSPVRAFRAVNRIPRFIRRASGSKIYDADGNEYIDYVCSWGPSILGHGVKEIVTAVQESAAEGLTFGAPTERELILAELVHEMMPVIEVMRLVNSGTEAVMSAVRVARGYTGRDLIVKFEGCYHGHSDGMLVKAGSGAITAAVPDSGGVPAGYAKNTLVAAYNSPSSVEELFRQRGDDIAAVIVEPVAANMGVVLPSDGFLPFLRDITSRYGSLLIFDEVITGFRLAQGGACEYFGIEPDLVTLGKIVGGGMPLGAYGGKRDVMKSVSPDGTVYQAGTLAGNPVATAAGIAMLNLIRNRKGLYERLENRGRLLADAFRKACGDKVTVNQIGSLLSVFFTPYPVTDCQSARKSDLKTFSRYFSHMLDHGIYLAPSQFEALFISDAHSDEDLKRTCEVISAFRL
ncbi:glutamate-1-semialdehyde 2,1-aminomutase [Succinimonas sp.]|uniref:glutamate-1-semialdehyde 2,1-aminomutase n=1 Tax=Succinimonas sp. TaxID=1936151 RepID=UPI00386921BE